MQWNFLTRKKEMEENKRAAYATPEIQYKDSEYIDNKQVIGNPIVEIEADIESVVNSPNIGMLTIQTANQAIIDAINAPDPVELYHCILYEGEVACLFADSNLGKSIFAVQIGEHIAWTGKKVLYLDCELTDKQFQLRYTDKETKDPHIFPDTFLRAKLNTEAMDTENYEVSIISDIEKAALRVKADVVIVDNLTYLCNDSEQGANAGTFMKRLCNLKKEYGLTLLIIAHTPKRDVSRPITKNDLAGSRKLFNFFDTVFTIGESALDDNLRYLKQVKVRAGEFKYTAENVAVYEITSVRGGVVFELRYFSTEAEHLRARCEEDDMQTVRNIMDLAAKGMSTRQISKELGLSKSKVGRIIKSNRMVAPTCPTVPKEREGGTMGQRDTLPLKSPRNEQPTLL